MPLYFLFRALRAVHGQWKSHFEAFVARVEQSTRAERREEWGTREDELVAEIFSPFYFFLFLFFPCSRGAYPRPLDSSRPFFFFIISRSLPLSVTPSFTESGGVGIEVLVLSLSSQWFNFRRFFWRDKTMGDKTSRNHTKNHRIELSFNIDKSEKNTWKFELFASRSFRTNNNAETELWLVNFSLRLFLIRYLTSSRTRHYVGRSLR